MDATRPPHRAGIYPLAFDSDHLTLRGVYHHPANVAVPPVIIGLHGLMANADSPKQRQMADACVRRGLGYLRIDHRGCGNSEGRFAEVTSFAGRCRDALAAARRVQDMALPVGGLFGSSMGGAVALRVAADLAVSAVVTVAAPIRSADVFLDDEMRLGLGAPVSAEHLAFDLKDDAAKLPALLLFHGENDAVVPYRHARELFERATPAKKLITLSGGDHRVSSPPHQTLLIREAAAWFERHVGARPTPTTS